MRTVNRGSAASARRSGGGSHLSQAAKELIFSRITQGDGNAAVNAALVAARHLSHGQTLSRQTLSNYRNDPRGKVEMDRLTLEAVQVGHVALSDSIVMAVMLMGSAFEQLMEGDDRLKPLSPAERNSFVNQWSSSLNFIWSRIGRPELLLNTLQAHETAAQPASRISEEDRLEIELHIRRDLTEMARQALREQHAARALAPAA